MSMRYVYGNERRIAPIARKTRVKNLHSIQCIFPEQKIRVVGVAPSIAIMSTHHPKSTTPISLRPRPHSA